MTTGNTLNTTVDEWRAALSEAATEHGPLCGPYLWNGKTTAELAVICGVGKSTMKLRLKKMLKAEMCIRGYSYKFDSAGKRMPIPVYELVKTKPTKS